MCSRNRFSCAIAALACAFAVLIPSERALAEVEYLVKWIPGDDDADGYRVHIGDQSGSYDELVDFGAVTPDGDGIARRSIMIDETRDRFLVMDAYNEAGLSVLSNQIVVAAAACQADDCDDGNVCTMDGCQGESCASYPVADGTLCGSGGLVCVSGSCEAVECLSGSDCSDGNLCNGNEICLDFECAAGRPPTCGTPSQCKAPACDPASGCTTVNVPDGTSCNDGSSSTAHDHCTLGECAGAPIEPQCGDGVRDPGEQCDDGNNQSGDGCSAGCDYERCGDGIVQPERGEECDDANLALGDGCSSECLAEVCGNHRLDFGEGCDDGNLVGGDGCEADCTVAGCGNGLLAEDEQCDDGNSVSGDGCDANCTETACGNGVVTEGELCDDGNAVDGDGCSSTCEIDFGAQTRAQRHCITAINRHVARVGRAQGRVNGRCLAAWVGGRIDRLGPDPATLDSCMAADPNGRVQRAQERLAGQEADHCLPEELPTIALGADRLAGSAAARAEAIGLMTDLLGNPAAFTPSGDAAVTRCQRQLTKRATRVFEAFGGVASQAKARKLRGRGTDPAGSDEALTIYIENALFESAALARSSERLRRTVEGTCAAVDLPSHFPGCAGDLSGVGVCADRSARCRACIVFRLADPLLMIDCDRLDDGNANLTCQP